MAEKFFMDIHCDTMIITFLKMKRYCIHSFTVLKLFFLLQAFGLASTFSWHKNYFDYVWKTMSKIKAISYFGCLIFSFSKSSSVFPISLKTQVKDVMKYHLEKQFLLNRQTLKR